MEQPPEGKPPLIDSHAHLDSPDYSDDLASVAERWREAGLAAVVSIGIEPAGWAATLSLAGQYRDVFPALGIHPNSADQTNDAVLEELADMCKAHNVVGLGETGLDYYRQYVSHDTQKRAFQAHLELARLLDLPVIIHNRDAHADLLETLKRDGKGTRGVMHSFSGDVEYAMECLKLDYMISLSGPVTFKKAADKHAVAAAVPLDMLLVETDCPYLTPEPYRGRRNEPAYVAYTAGAIARLRNIPYSQVAEACTANACALFNLPIAAPEAAPQTTNSAELGVPDSAL